VAFRTSVAIPYGTDRQTDEGNAVNNAASWWGRAASRIKTKEKAARCAILRISRELAAQPRAIDNQRANRAAKTLEKSMSTRDPTIPDIPDVGEETPLGDKGDVSDGEGAPTPRGGGSAHPSSRLIGHCMLE